MEIQTILLLLLKGYYLNDFTVVLVKAVPKLLPSAKQLVKAYELLFAQRNILKTCEVLV